MIGARYARGETPVGVDRVVLNIVASLNFEKLLFTSSASVRNLSAELEGT